ncbi:MAG: 3'-5' exonuclease domain-containing protein 2 [Bacteroidales bacterium]|nr:3'-5' exonuclease domain-containing protein 2 [Bacteroidales bacterium]
MFEESINIEEIVKLPYLSFPGRVQVITEEGEEFDEAIAYLSSREILGFDTETRPCFSPNQPRSQVSLLQLSSGERAFLFRLKTLKLKEALRDVLSNPNILKIGAAVKDDIRALQRLGFFNPAGFVDLQQIVWQWGVRDKSVKKMSALILGVRISKTQQLSNWEAPVLSESQIKYAATDAWVCEEMYKKLQQSEKNPLPPDPLPEPKVVEPATSVEPVKESKPKCKNKRKYKKKKKKTSSNNDQTHTEKR